MYLCTCPCVYSYVVSEPYSRVPDNRNWRYRVVDLDVFVNGSHHYLPYLKKALKGREHNLHGLTVSYIYSVDLANCLIHVNVFLL